ncbi:MAG: hypothetical protein ACRDSS_15700, partial [Actinocrinis sp.]
MTDTMSSTPQPPRPQPGDQPSPRFRLPDPPDNAAAPSYADTVPRAAQSPAARAAETPRPPQSSGAGSRYGEKRSGMSRGRKWGLAAVGLAILCGVVGYIGWQLANPS